MYCSYCGKQLADDGAFCSGCGNRVDGGSPNSFMTTDNAQQITSNQQAYMPNNNMYGGSSGAFHCPRCKSTNLETISSTEVRSSSKGGFSIGKGCLGYLCLGPFGILCGACSKTKVNTSVRSKTAWVCKNCSHRFKDLDAINQELKAAKITPRSLTASWGPRKKSKKTSKGFQPPFCIKYCCRNIGCSRNNRFRHPTPERRKRGFCDPCGNSLDIYSHYLYIGKV